MSQQIVIVDPGFKSRPNVPGNPPILRLPIRQKLSDPGLRLINRSLCLGEFTELLRKA